MNMGLGGLYDGWYAVNNILNYLDQYSQDAVIGITPDNTTDYLMTYDKLKPGSTLVNIIKLENNDNIDNKVYEAVKFNPEKCGYLNHISYFIPFTHISYDIKVYEGGDNITSALETSPIYTTTGTTNTTGWNFVECSDNIEISANKSYYVLISFANILEDFDYIIPDYFKYLVSTDTDGEGTGNSYYGTSVDNLEQKTGEDVLIRVGLKNSYTCTSTVSDNSTDNSSYTTSSPSSDMTLYKYDGENVIFNPDNVTVEIEAQNNIIIQPKATISKELIGEEVSLKLSLYLQDYNVWIPYEDVETTLSETTTFTNITEPIDFTGMSGLRFSVWYGFTLNNQDLYYNNYDVVVK
jgi:hypothetical protein